MWLVEWEKMQALIEEIIFNSLEWNPITPTQRLKDRCNSVELTGKRGEWDGME